MTSPDPFGPPAAPRLPDRGDPFGLPSDSGRATRTGDAEDRAEVPRDQWGRYLMPQQDGTKPAPNKGMTRVSTTKSALSNTFGIQKWNGRRIVQGLAINPDAVAAAMRAAAMPEGPEREKAFGRIADGAFQTGGGKERAGLGTEFHEITEDLNRGTLIRENVDEKWTPDLGAYDQLLIDNDLTPLAEYLERQVLCPYNQAGTFDNIMRYWNPDTEEYELVIVDLKTGRKLDLGWLEILIQLWSYANAYAMWTTTKVIRDPKDETKITEIEGFYEPMPRELRTDKAFVIHTPLDGTASLIELDLSGVERYVRAAVEAKRANAEAPKKVRTVATIRPDAFTPPAGPVNVTQNLNPTAAGVVQTTATTTPQMLADEAKANERRIAAVEALSRPGQVGVPATAEPEKDPTTGRRKRTCGHCRKPGHTQKTCPENPASTKYVPPIIAGAPMPQPIPAGEPAPENNCDHLRDGDWHPYVEGQCSPDGPADSADDAAPPPARVVLTDPGGQPYCTQNHACQWTSQHPNALGQWVCSVSGKPGRQAWENQTTAVTPVPPLYGAPPVEQPQTPMMTPAQQVEKATTVDQLLKIRDYNIEAGTWSTELEELGRLRYQKLI